jgi:aerotolerance regulator-like protein
VSFLAPLWLGAAALAVAGVVALHLVTTQRPKPMSFPTARFVPEGDARASSRAARPSDLPLMLLRCAALLLLGAAFAGPVARARRSALARVVVADRSHGSLADVRDSALAIARAGDALVLFDSAARVVNAHAAESLGVLVPSRARGSLSSALVAAERAAGELARGADSVELVIVSPLTSDELDAASAITFARWPGRARLVRTASAQRAVAAVTVSSDDPDDPLRPPVAALNAMSRAGASVVPVRVMRRAPLAADSAAARAGAAIVYWPRMEGATRAAEGLWADGATVVAPLARLSLPPGGRVVARWADGERAAAEWPVGRGCIREVAVGVPPAGDVTLQPAFAAVARALVAPCEGASAGSAAPDSLAARFARGGAAASASAIRSSGDRAALAPWLAGAGLLLLIGELFVRRAPPELPA